MKYILVFLVAAVVTVKAEETYGTDYDNLDIEAIVADKERLKSFVDCFTDVAPCNEVHSAFKKSAPLPAPAMADTAFTHRWIGDGDPVFTSATAATQQAIPEAMVQACAKCTNAQKHIVRVFFEGFMNNMPQELVKFKDTYDPEGKYFSKFEEAVANF